MYYGERLQRAVDMQPLHHANGPCAAPRAAKQ